MFKEKERDFVKRDDKSIENMEKVLKVIKSFLIQKENVGSFAEFILNNVVFIYVATDTREDAFRLFTILNNRGVPLTNADILKAVNIGEIEKAEGERKAEEYAQKWEEIQASMGEEFDHLLEFIRTILVKDKQRKNLADEFEEKIYSSGLLKKGKETIGLIEKYYQIYCKIIDFSAGERVIEDEIENNEYKNLITVTKTGFPKKLKVWIPALLYFYYKFGNEKLFDFLKKLELKVSSDWILKAGAKIYTNIYRILRQIERANIPDEVVNSHEIFEIDLEELKRVLLKDVYGKSFCLYVLLKYEYLIRENTQYIGDYSILSVEHILPQNPPANSMWRRWFTDQEIEEYRHKLGNLVLLNRRKNASLSNLDFEEKKLKYFAADKQSPFTGINWIMQKKEWRKENIEERTKAIVSKIIGVDKNTRESNLGLF